MAKFLKFYSVLGPVVTINKDKITYAEPYTSPSSDKKCCRLVFGPSAGDCINVLGELHDITDYLNDED